MVATVLAEAGLDPSYTCGTSEIMPIGAAGHYGLGRYFVAEADEYLSEPKYDRKAKFLYQKPRSIILNNIDFDHPDFYSDVEAVKKACSEFVSSLGHDGLLVANGDDEKVKEIIRENGIVRSLTYGTGPNNDFIVFDFHEKGLNSTFKIKRKDMLIGEFSLSVPGYHNAKNAAGVVALLLELGISIPQIAKGLAAFKGVKRRIEVVGQTANGQTIIDDYAHHPEEIRKTLAALRLAFPDKKIVTVFQFHTYSRTKALFSDFVSAFSDADEIILLPTFSSERNETDEQNSDQNFVEKMRLINKRIDIIDRKAGVVEYINKNFKDEDVVIVTMGAGDVYNVGEKLKVSAKG